MKERKEFPSDPEERLDCLSNVVNTEFKTLTLLALGDQPMHGGDIRRTLRNIVGEGASLPSITTFNGYCDRTLFPIGIVAKDEYKGDGSVGYVLTEGGRKYGFPVAAFALDWAIQNNRSLYTALGRTISSKESTSPLNRIKILEALDGGTISETELVRKTSVPRTPVLGHIRTLDSEGFVEFIKGDENVPVRRMNTTLCLTGIPKNLGGRPAEILKILKKDLNISGVEIAERIGLTPSTTYHHLQRLAEKGVISYELEENFTSIKLRSLGKRVLEDFIYPSRDLVGDGDSLEKGEEIYNIINSDIELKAEYWRKALELYRSVSPYIERSSRPREEIVDYLRRNPASKPKEIVESLGKKDVYVDLKKLWIAGKIVKDDNGRYSIK